jgi:DNA-binding transcriptional ArsR family regulator
MTIDVSAELPGLEFDPAERYVIQTLEELRIIANPLRLRILDALIAAPQTVKQVGDTLGISSKKLYYHVNELERVGLVRLVHTEIQSGIQVKYYRAVAGYFYLTASMLHSDRHDGKQTASREFLAFLLESSAVSLRRSVEDGTLDRNRDAFIVSRRRLRLSSEQATALRDQLRTEERAILELDDPDGELTMSYVFALFPLSEGGQ